MQKLGLTRGFTVMEIIAVIAIISVLMALLLTSIFKVRTLADIRAAKATIEQLEAALEMYSQNYGTYPNEDARVQNGPILEFWGCSNLITALEADDVPAKEKGGPYVKYAAVLKNVYGLLDPWGVAYRYHWNTYPTSTNPTWPHVTAIGQGNGVNVPNITYNLWSCGPDTVNDTERSGGANGYYPEPPPPNLQKRLDDVINW